MCLAPMTLSTKSGHVQACRLVHGKSDKCDRASSRLRGRQSGCQAIVGKVEASLTWSFEPDQISSL